jgi:hypothetical protein
MKPILIKRGKKDNIVKATLTKEHCEIIERTLYYTQIILALPNLTILFNDTALRTIEVMQVLDTTIEELRVSFIWNNIKSLDMSKDKQINMIIDLFDRNYNNALISKTDAFKMGIQTGLDIAETS